jgi:hypothetical protein
MVGNILKNNHPTNIDPVFLKDLNIKIIRIFVYEVLSKKN